MLVWWTDLSVFNLCSSCHDGKLAVSLSDWQKCTEGLVKTLRDIANSPYSPEYDVAGITDPFLHIRLLKLLRVLGQGDAEASDCMNDILAQVCSYLVCRAFSSRLMLARMTWFFISAIFVILYLAFWKNLPFGFFFILFCSFWFSKIFNKIIPQKLHFKQLLQVKPFSHLYKFCYKDLLLHLLWKSFDLYQSGS